ncbi:alpha/beta fold hydrolase [Lyngbya aestuarii]|uniref:alpha/beta fold hydrolase n=1 Tax=Lyngbya aestuarii TaxID=118322 RepID=UPI00403DB7DD
MSNLPDVLWLNTSPSFQHFDQSLLRQLSAQVSIGQWEYRQSQDEPCSLDIALLLLHDALKNSNRPIHLVGHSTAGLLGLLYARQHPERVKSLTMLAVGVYPTIDWQAYYCVQRLLLPCDRQQVIAQMVRSLFGFQEQRLVKNLVGVLERDLRFSPSPHSLYERMSMSPGAVPVPLMVCGSKNDIIVDSNSLQGWQTWLKEGDRLWECPDGHHFFHYFHPKLVKEQILDFWQSFHPQLFTKSNQLEYLSANSSAEL